MWNGMFSRVFRLFTYFTCGFLLVSILRRPNCMNRLIRRNSGSHIFRFPKKTVTSSKSLAAFFHTHAATWRKFLTFSINGQSVRLQVDTASYITILSKKTWRTLGQPPMKPWSQTAVSACRVHLRLHGELNSCILLRCTIFNGTSYITKSPLNLLSLD